MIKTKIKKALALSWIIAISATSLISSGLSTTYAATQIGTGSITDSGSSSTAIMWDDLFPGTASGEVSGIIVKARVLPTLTMEVSTGTIDLGNLVANVASTGSLFIEIGTNAKSWVTVTARSGSGWLTKTDDSSIKINSGTLDWVSESYKFFSTLNDTDDSSDPSFTGSKLIPTEVNSNIIENTVYTTNKPESKTGIDDVTFSVSAETTAETPAWNYQDTITFTVTGNF